VFELFICLNAYIQWVFLSFENDIEYKKEWNGFLFGARHIAPKTEKIILANQQHLGSKPPTHHDSGATRCTDSSNSSHSFPFSCLLRSRREKKQVLQFSCLNPKRRPLSHKGEIVRNFAIHLCVHCMYTPWLYDSSFFWNYYFDFRLSMKSMHQLTCIIEQLNLFCISLQYTSKLDKIGSCNW
jgi:hypothetical protein